MQIPCLAEHQGVKVRMSEKKNFEHHKGDGETAKVSEGAYI